MPFFVSWKAERCPRCLRYVVLAGSVAPSLCPVFLLHLGDGLPFDFQQGIWFPQDGPQRTQAPAFLADRQQALAVIEELIRSCELAVDLAAVIGCPVCHVP